MVAAVSPPRHDLPPDLILFATLVAFLPESDPIPTGLDNDRETKLAELLDLWEDLFRVGTDVRPSILCWDCPDLTADLGIRINWLRRVRYPEGKDSPTPKVRLT